MKRIATIVALICAVTFQVNAQNTESEILNFDPLLQWGCSIADVEQHMQQKEWWTDGNDKLEYWEDPYQCWHRWYFVDKAELMLTEQYLFETKDGQNLRYVVSICWNDTVPGEKFVNTLIHQGFHYSGERVGFDSDIFMRFLSADSKTEALFAQFATEGEGQKIVIYRPVESSQPITEFPYSLDFENGFEGWTANDANNDDISWIMWYTSPDVHAHSGNLYAASLSWMEEGVQADDYLVSPEIFLPADQPAALSWWFCVHPGYPEDKYAVKLSTTGAAASDFTTTLFDITPTAEHGDWTQQTLDLSAYAGQSIRLAFYHHGYDNNYIAIDDILIATGDPSGIQRLAAEDANREWFDLQGRKLAAKPARRGLYFQGNKKIYIK